MNKGFFSGKKRFFFLFIYFSDVISFCISAYLSMMLFGISPNIALYARFFIFSLMILIFSFSNHGLYKDKRNLFDDSDFMGILYSVATAWMIVIIFVLMFEPTDLFLIGAASATMLASLILTTIGRMTLSSIISAFRTRGYDSRNTIFFGSKDDPLLEKISDRHLGYNIIRVTNKISELKSSIKSAKVVFIKMESVDEPILEMMIENDQVNWKIVSSVLNLVIDPVTFDEFKDYPIINIADKDDTDSYGLVKRMFDILASGLAIVVLSPLLILIAIGVKLSSPGPVFYKHERLGKNLRPFMLYKFRSMSKDVDFTQNKVMKNEVKGIFKMKDDPRVTRFGKFIRRACVDELGQLINIFKGDMSIVGPRPHLRTELPNFRGWRMARFKVKPGLTGLWQVNGRHELNFDKAMLYDIYYVKHMNFFLDLSIILKTVPAIIMTRGRY